MKKRALHFVGILACVLLCAMLSSCLIEGETVTVTFVYNDGTGTVKTQNILKGDVIINPEATNDDLIGWCAENGSVFDFNTPITEDILLTALWTNSSSAQKVVKSVTVTSSELAGNGVTISTSNTPDGDKKSETTVSFPANALSSSSTSAEVDLEITTYSVSIASIASAETTPFTIDAKKAGIAGIDCEVEVNGEIVESFSYTDASGNEQYAEVIVTTYIAKGLTSPVIKYKLSENSYETWSCTASSETDSTIKAPTSVGSDGVAYYDSTTGKLVFKTKHFSTFYVEADADAYIVETNTAYATLADAFSAVKADETITLLRDCETGEYIGIVEEATSGNPNPLVLDKDNVTLDLNGKTLTVTHNFSFVIAGDGDIVKNGTIRSKEKKGSNSEYYRGYPLVVSALTNGTIAKNVKIQNMTIYGGVSAGGSVDQKATHILGAGNATLENCSIKEGSVWTLYSQLGSTLNVVSGSYYKGNSGLACAESNSTISITGGTFDVDPSAYVADEHGAHKVSADEWTVVKQLAVWVDGKRYDSMSSAFAKCSNGNGQGYVLAANKIVFYMDIEDQGLWINDGSSIEVDFNEHTYTVTSAVGSQGTASQALHFEGVNSTVVLKNGTINVKSGAMNVKQAFQNYTNFTAENMKLDFTNVSVPQNPSGEMVGFSRSKTNETFINCVITLPDSDKGIYANGTLTFTNTKTNADIVFDADPLTFKYDSSSSFGKFRKTTRWTNTGTANEGSTTEGVYTVLKANIN